MKKYEQLAKILKEQIQQGIFPPGSKLPSEHDLCSQYSISRNVVRQALKNLEEEGITETIKGVGTFCRSGSSHMRLSYTIGFISFFSDSYIFPQIISGADDILFPKGFHLLLGQSMYDLNRERMMLERFIKRGVDGIILEPVNNGEVTGANRGLLKTLHDKGIPIICIDNTVEGIPAPGIILDDYHAGQQAAEHLTEMGHRKTAIFYQSDYITKQRRMMGARDFLAGHPEASDPVLIPFTGQGELSKAENAASIFFRNFDGNCTAVFCSSDEDSEKLIAQAAKVGIRVPEDLSVIGFDNQPAPMHRNFQLTTFEHPSSKMGRLAAMMLMDQILHPEEPRLKSVELEAVFIEGDSVRNLTS